MPAARGIRRPQSTPGVAAALLVCQLLAVARGASVSRDDYFSAEDGWDLMGLKSDLEIFAKQGKESFEHSAADAEANIVAMNEAP